MRRTFRFAAIVMALLMCAAGAGAILLLTPAGAANGEVFLDIERGWGTRRIAQALAENRVIGSEWQFLAVRALRPEAKLQAGEYRFEGQASPWTVFGRIARGDIFFHEVTIPEGSNMFEIAGILDEQGIIKGSDFLSVARTSGLIRDLAPEATSLEGYLFPATYRMTKHTTALHLARDMTERFRRAWKAAGAKENVHEAVTLASLVEKETGRPEERKLVASVFRNRLDRGMRLDCDPTTIYAALLEGRYRGTIYKSDLESTHPYNTYRRTGLPPGPIANPGQKSIEAAVRPAETNYLFFVAKPDHSGGHIFSATMEAHDRAVMEYRRGQQKGKAAPSSSRTSRPGKGRSD